MGVTAFSAPWICAGDFNEILEAQEQFGGVTRPESQMEGFRNAVNACGFSDLGFIGLPYTWDNRQQGADNIKVRLDRAFATESFSDLFRETKVWNMQTTESDHSCLIIECNCSNRGRSRKQKKFRYENMWRRDPSYMKLVEDPWGDGAAVHDMNPLHHMLGKMQSSLREWEVSIFGSVRTDLARLRRELEDVRR